MMVREASHYFVFLALLLFVGCLLSPSARADTTETTWNGGTTDWSAATPGNWSGSVLPSTTVSAVFNSAFTNQPVLGAGGQTAEGIWVTGSGSTGLNGLTTISGAPGLTITGGATLDSVSAGILLDGTGNNSLTISAPVTVTNSQSFIVNNVSTLTLSGGITLGTRTVTIGSGSGSTAGGATDNASGIYTLTGGESGATAGLFDVNTNGTVNMSGTYSETSRSQMTSGTLNFTGSMIGASGFHQNGGTLNINGSGQIGTTATGSSNDFAVSGGIINVNATNGITGALTLFVVDGSGQAFLNSANNYAGGTSLGSGSNGSDGSSVTISNAGAFGSGSLSIGGGTLIATAPMTITNALVSSGAGGAIIAGTNAIIFSGAVTDTPSGSTGRPWVFNDSGGVIFQGGSFSMTGNTPFTGSGNVTFNEGIVGGGSSANFSYGGTGTASLTASNTSLTSTIFANSGTLLLDFSVSDPSSIINSTSTLSGQGGTLAIKGSGGTNTQSFASTSLTGGASTINLEPNGDTTLTITLGAITHTLDGTLNFSTIPLTSGVIATAVGTTVNANGSGIIDPWITVGTSTGLEYAALNGSNQIVAYTGATSAGTNLSAMTSLTTTTEFSYSGTASTAGSATLTGDTLQYTGGASTTTLGSGTTLTLNGLMNSGTGGLTITNGTNLIIGPDKELDITSDSQRITIITPITNNSGGASSLSYSGTGTLVLDATNTYTGGTYLNSGTLLLQTATTLDATGTLTIVGGSIGSNASSSLTESNNPAQSWQGNFGFAGANSNTLSLGTGAITLAQKVGSSVTITMGGTSSDVLNVQGAISGGDGLAIAGSSSTLELSAANTYSGPTYLDGATVEVNATETVGTSGAFGTTGLIFFNGGTLEYTSTDHTTDFSSRFAGAQNQAFNINTNGQNVTYASIITSLGGTLTKSGTGTLTLSAANAFTGNTTVSAGTLDLDNSRALQDSTLTTAGITFDQLVTTNAFTFGGLSGSSNIGLQNNAGTPAAVALSVGNNNSNTSYSGTLSDAGSFSKIGSGSQTLTGPNTYGGGTTVYGGTLFINNSTGSGTGSGAVGVTGTSSTALATLSGNGTISGAVTVNAFGVVAPGATSSDTAGNLTLSSSLTMASTSASLSFNLGTSHASSLLTINSGTFDGNAINFNDTTGGSGLSTGLYELIASSNDMSTITTSGPAGDGNNIVNGGVSIGSGLSGSYTDQLELSSNGDDLFLDITAASVPEPSTYALIIAGLGFLALSQCRRLLQQGFSPKSLA